MSFLDTLLQGVKSIANGSTALPQRPQLVFTGAGVVVSDSSSTNQTVVSIDAAGGASQYNTTLANGLNSNVAVPNPSSIGCGGYSGAVILGGIAPTTPPTPGQLYQINFTVSGQPVTIRNNDASSSAANRILTGTGSDVLLPPGQTPKCYLQYDGTLNCYTLQSSGVHQVRTPNAKDFGAQGDGTTDDTTALQTGLNYMESTGGTLFCPQGTYVTSATLAIPPGVSLKGAGSGTTTTIALTHSADPSLDVIQCSNTTVIEDLEVTHGPTTGITAWSASSSSFVIGDYYKPALPACMIIKLVSGSGPTGAQVPLGQLGGYGGVALSGTSPLGSYDILIKIVTSGTLGGGMTFQYSTNGGSSYLPATPVTPPAANQSWAYAIPGTGITATFPAGATPYSSTANPNPPNLGAGIIAPFPLVVVSGTPTSAVTLDIAIGASGPLGVGGMTFQFATNGTNKFNAGTYGGLLPTTAGSSYAYVVPSGPAQGLTITFYPGHYLNQGGAALYSPSFGWSMQPGELIVDDGYTWEMVRCGAPISLVGPVLQSGSGFITIRNVQMNYGAAGIIGDQVEALIIDSCLFQTSSMCGIWITNGNDHTFGAETDVSNQIAIIGRNTFYTPGYGIIYDGGLQLELSGAPNFQNCGAGWIYIAGASGLSIHGVYIETNGGVARNSTYNARNHTTFSFNGFTFHGNNVGTESTSALDCYIASDLCATGNAFAGPLTYAFSGINNVLNAFEAGNFITAATIFDVLTYTENTISLSGGINENWLPGLAGAQSIAMNHNSASYQIVCYGPEQTVKLDTSTANGGAFVAEMPAAPTIGQRVTLKDFTSALAFHWGTTPGQWSVASGIKIENPNSPGTLVTAGTITAPAANGGSYTYEWVAEGAWLLV